MIHAQEISCVYTKETLVHTQEIYRDLLCMHNTLVHALGQGTQGPWPLGSLAQSMHKSVVHAQEISCVYRYRRDSFVYTQEIFCVYTREGM